MKKRILLVIAAIMLCVCASVAFAADSHPGMLTISTGHGINVGYTVYPGHSDYPMYCTFMLDEFTIPLQSCRLGIYNYDCDENNNIAGTREYDMVFINDVFVGTLTGQDGTWNTSYIDVPVSVFKIGENKITIYVGHADWDTGAVEQHSPYWVVRVDRLTLQFDGGQSDNAPDTFDVTLDYAIETPNGIQCGATAIIESKTPHSYVIEYSLVDKCSGSPTYGQIIAADTEKLTGSNLVSTGHFDLGYQPPMGTYVIECTLSDPNTGEVFASDTYTFNLGDALEGECKHEGMQDDTFSRTVYRMLSSDDAQYDTHHQMQDVSWNICSLCGNTYYIYGEWQIGEHTLPVCACGYVEAGYQPIKSAVFESVNGNYVGSDHVIRVVTDEYVGKLSAVNNHGYPVSTKWVKSDNGDGTCTWTCVYQPTVASSGRYWKVTAYNLNNRVLGTENTNRLDIVNGKPVVEEPVQSIQTYTIRVVDAATAANIPGATVTLCGQSAQTNADGVAVFDYSTLTGRGLFVTKTGSRYDTAQNATFTPGYPGGMEVVTLSEQKYKLTSASVNGESMLTQRQQINNKLSRDQSFIYITGDTAVFELHCHISDGAQVLEYAIIQQDTVLGSSVDGKIEICNTAFVQNAPVEARVKVRYANGVEGEFTERLNLGIASFTWHDNTVLNKVASVIDVIDPALVIKGGGNGFAGFIGNLFKQKDLKNKVYIEPKFALDNESRSAGIGVDVGAPKENKGDIIRTKKDGTQKNVGKYATSAGFHVVPTLLYVEEFNEYGRQSAFGELKIEIGWRGSGEWSFWAGFFPVVLKVRYEMNLEGKVSDLGMNVQTNELLVPTVYLGGNGSLSPSLGIGVTAGNGKAKAHAGIRGTLGIKGSWKIPFEEGSSVSASVEVYGDFGIYAEFGIQPFVLTGYWKLAEGTIWKSGEAIELIQPLTNAQYFASCRKLAHAGVISDVGFANGQKAGRLVVARKKAQETQVASAGKTTLMVYLADEQINGITGSALWYQEWVNGAWSEPKRVSAAGRFDGEFHVYSDGENIYVAYTRLNREVTYADLPQPGDDETTALNKVYKGLQSFDLHAAVFEPGKGFRSLGRLTQDQVFDSWPTVFAAGGQVVVAWVKSQDDATVSNTSEVHAATLNADGSWTEKTLRGAGNPVSELGVGTLHGQITVVANEIINDTDGSELVAYTLDGQATLLDSGSCGSPVFGADVLYWNVDGAVKRIEDCGAEPGIVLGEEYGVGGKMVLSTGHGYDMMMFGVQDFSQEDVTTQIYGILLNDENAEPVVLATFPGSSYTLDRLTLPGGIFVTSDVLNVNAAGQPSYSLCSEYIPFGVQLYPLSISYPISGFQAGAELNLIAELYNGGVKPIEQVNIHVNDEIVQTIDVSISAGQVVEMPFTLQLPAEMKGTLQYGFSAGANTAEVAVQELSLERTDMLVYADELLLGKKCHLQYSVQNIGTVDCDATLRVYADQKDGALLYELELHLAAGHVANDFFLVEDMLKQTESNTLYVEVVADGDEEADNNAAVVFFVPFGE